MLNRVEGEYDAALLIPLIAFHEGEITAAELNFAIERYLKSQNESIDRHLVKIGALSESSWQRISEKASQLAPPPRRPDQPTLPATAEPALRLTTPVAQEQSFSTQPVEDVFHDTMEPLSVGERDPFAVVYFLDDTLRSFTFGWIGIKFLFILFAILLVAGIFAMNPPWEDPNAPNDDELGAATAASSETPETSGPDENDQEPPSQLSEEEQAIAEGLTAAIDLMNQGQAEDALDAIDRLESQSTLDTVQLQDLRSVKICAALEINSVTSRANAWQILKQQGIRGQVSQVLFANWVIQANALERAQAVADIEEMDSSNKVRLLSWISAADGEHEAALATLLTQTGGPDDVLTDTFFLSLAQFYAGNRAEVSTLLDRFETLLNRDTTSLSDVQQEIVSRCLASLQRAADALRSKVTLPSAVSE